MFTVHPITDLDHPELEPYRTMKRVEEHRLRGIFVAEGDKVVKRLLASNHGIISMLLPSDRLECFSTLLEARPEEVTVYTASKPLLETLTGYVMYQGVLALGRVPAARQVHELVVPGQPVLLTALEGIANAENMGVILRNAAAFGFAGAIVGESSCSPYLRRAVRNSMGAVFNLPVVESPSLRSSLLKLKGLGVRLIAAHPHSDEVTLHTADLRGSVCVVLGSEGHGITEETLALCDAAVAIPRHREVDSLNVASAAAAFFYEARKQNPRPA